MPTRNRHGGPLTAASRHRHGPVRLLLAVALLATLPGAFAFSSRARAAAATTPVVDPSAAPYDLVPDGVIDYADVQEVVLAWEDQRDIGSPCANLIDPGRDVNHDGCIDIADVQAVAARLGVVTGGRAEDAAARTADGAAADDAGPQAAAFANLTFTVNTTADDDDANPGDGACATAARACSLRAAITEANLAPGPNTIAFNIPGSGVQTIVISRTLPTIAEQAGPLTINGYTQPGATPNTDPVVSNAVIRVMIAGPVSEPNITCTSSTCNLTNCLRITSPNNVIRGLAFFKVRRAVWLSGSGARGNVIAGNFIGTSPSGQLWASKSYNVAFGITLKDGPTNNRFGGTAPADRNVISGNAQDGANFAGEGVTGNQIVNNLIGLTPNGLAKLSNRGQGIDVNYGTQSTTISGNIIAGNFADGIEISHGSATSLNQVTNNLIGTNLAGTGGGAVYQNGGYGVDFEDGPTGNTVSNNVIANNLNGGVLIYGPLDATVERGNNRIANNRLGVGVHGEAIPSGPDGVLLRLNAVGDIVGPGNIISNFGVGVRIIDSSTRDNTVTRNSIFGNAGLGIDIEPTGVNHNDQFSHSGANDRLNFPVIASASATTVGGTACAGCTVEVFKADHDSSGYGEGKTFVGSATANGAGAFSAAVTGLSAGDAVTATATDANGNTSEFARNVTVSGAAPARTPLPGTLQAEDYRAGGEGVGYHDTTAGNSGGADRNDDVDIQPTTDAGGGYNVGWIAAGEWLAYDVSVATAGNVTFTLRYASPSTANRQAHVEVDGVNVTGSIVLPPTGGYQNWANASSKSVAIGAGNHVVKIVMENGGWNLNDIVVASH